MARPSPWQLIQAHYPYSLEVPPRYSDLDVLGHVNNVAIAAFSKPGESAFTTS